MAHGCADFRSYFDEVFLAKQLAKRAGICGFRRSTLEQSLPSLEIYHQRFSFAAKVFIEDVSSEEMFLFGYKSRWNGRRAVTKKSVIAFTEVKKTSLKIATHSMSRTDKLIPQTLCLSILNWKLFQNGLSSVIGIADLPKLMDGFIFGYLNFPNRQQRPLQSCSEVADFFRPGKLSVDIGAGTPIIIILRGPLSVEISGS